MQHFAAIWVEPQHNCSRWEKASRYYQIHLQTDLFGWVIIKRWGGIINEATGQQRTSITI